MPRFINPYNFVSGACKTDKTSRPTTHERFNPVLYSGRLLDCKLEAITTLSTKSLREGKCLYGSSMKGMIRSVAEAIAQGCRVIDRPCAPSATSQRLCICCRIFGWLKGGNVHLGRVAISDAKPLAGNWSGTAYIPQHALSGPKPAHRSFYPNNGRKFYYHQNPGNTDRFLDRRSAGQQADSVPVAKPGSQFTFHVDFVDLTGPELGLLLYAMLLEDGWCHKLGYGKPLGFGTVKITVGSMELRPRDYYENWNACCRSLESTNMQNFIAERIDEFFTHQFDCSHAQANHLSHWRDLRHLMTQHPDYNIHYPSPDWFNHNPTHQLPTPAEIEANPDNWLIEEES